MDGGYSQYKAARCVEKTIVTIAKFSAASERTFLSFPIFLDAKKRTAHESDTLLYGLPRPCNDTTNNRMRLPAPTQRMRRFFWRPFAQGGGFRDYRISLVQIADSLGQ